MLSSKLNKWQGSMFAFYFFSFATLAKVLFGCLWEYGNFNSIRKFYYFIKNICIYSSLSTCRINKILVKIYTLIGTRIALVPCKVSASCSKNWVCCVLRNENQKSSGRFTYLRRYLHTSKRKWFITCDYTLTSVYADLPFHWILLLCISILPRCSIIP